MVFLCIFSREAHNENHLTVVIYTIMLAIISILSALLLSNPEPRTSVDKTLLLKLVNDVRRKGCQCGDTYYNPAPPLAWNELLEKAAWLHSADMERKGYFSHASLEGSRAGDRLDSVGYKWKSFGENIGMGYRNEKEVVAGWISSPSHCKNIMNRMYTEMGVGRSGLYWTQAFGSR